MSVPIPPPATAPISSPRKKGVEDRHRLSGPLSGRGYAPPCNRARQPILPAIIVVAQPAIVVVAAQESGYKAWARSGAGAMGMMQVMPGTARILELSNPWDALANMRAGARYLRQQLDRFGRVDLALAAYNAGPERRSLALGNIPEIPETRNYVQTITTNWVRLTKLGAPNSIVASRAMAANLAVRASGYREVSLITYATLSQQWKINHWIAVN